MTIAANLRLIRSQIDAACRRAGRTPDEVRLVAVSKKKPAADIDLAAAAGQFLFGENYVQEFVDKRLQVEHSVEWHFIGALQSNKVKYLAEHVSLIHSVDRYSLAAEIDRQAGKRQVLANILLQVNLGMEASKAGTTAAALMDLVRQIAPLEHVRIRGLMCLPPYLSDPEQVRPYFRELRDLARQIRELDLPQVEMKELSMGMSHDFSVAIEEGATLIRVGTAIFGERN
jgi:pyridoxal phosphate enzyme (YggS family)